MRKVPVIDGKKLCTRCNNTFEIAKFTSYKRKNGKVEYSWCKACSNEYKKTLPKTSRAISLVEEKKILVNKLKSGPCTDCGNKFPSVAMDFDHVKDEKKTSITRMVYQTHSIDTLLKEIEKCELVCANCHRVRTESRPRSWLTRLKISRAKGGKSVQHLQSGRIFSTASEAGRVLGIDIRAISEVLRGNRHDINGDVFRYIHEVKQENLEVQNPLN